MTTNVILTDQSGNLSSIGFPKGIIIMWYGSTDNIPPGWAACDGNNNTPDLRGRFVRMYSDDSGTFNKGIYSGINGATQTEDIVLIKNDIKKAYSGDAGINTINGTARAIFRHYIGDKGGTDYRKLKIDEFKPHTHSVDWGAEDYNNPNRWEEAGSWRNGSGRDAIASTLGNPSLKGAGVKIVTSGGGLEENNQPPYYVMTYIMKIV